jgi:cell division protein FtsI (penicillin-binding protein 3)
MSDGRKSILMRIYLIYFLVVAFAVLIFGKIIYIQWVEGSHWKQQSEELTYRYEIIEPSRGNIFAEDGKLLATSVPIFEIRLDLSHKLVPDSLFNKNLDSLALCLSNLFEGDIHHADKYKRDLRKARAAGNRGFLLKRNVTYSQLKKIRTFPILRMGKRGGLIENLKERREFPFGNLAGRTIGFERLAQYKVRMDFGKTVLPEDYIEKKADTLALCLSQLIKDQTQKQYAERIRKSFREKKSAFAIVKTLNELELDELRKFPIIVEDTASILSSSLVVKSYYVGLEGYYSRILRGEKGRILMRKSGPGGWRQVSDEDIEEPRNGCDIYTTIDVNLQDVAENSLRKCLDSNNALWGCAVLMEVQTGYIKAITNLTRDSEGQYREMRNYAVGEMIEPGSTFKLATVMAVLEEGTYDTTEIVNTGRISYPGWGEVVDSHEEGYGRISLSRAFEKSSNVGISEIIKKTFYKKPAELQKLFAQMGLTMKSGIDLGGELYPAIKVTQGDIIGISFGYALKMSPLQILTFYNAVANNGVMMKPMLVKEVRQKDMTLKKLQPVVLRKAVCSRKTIDMAQRLLEGVVEKGTATNIRRSAYKIAGKTGTAKIYMNGMYMSKYIASFAGYFPAESPKYSCIVVVYSPMGGEYYGSQIAAPVFKEIADKVYATRMDIHSKPPKAPDMLIAPGAASGYGHDIMRVYSELNFTIAGMKGSEWVQVKPSGAGVTLVKKEFEKDKMPDLRGMTARDAAFLLESMTLRVQVNGVGLVKTQQPLPGEKIKPGQQVIIELNTVSL